MASERNQLSPRSMSQVCEIARMGGDSRASMPHADGSSARWPACALTTGREPAERRCLHASTTAAAALSAQTHAGSIMKKTTRGARPTCRTRIYLDLKDGRVVIQLVTRNGAQDVGG